MKSRRSFWLGTALLGSLIAWHGPATANDSIMKAAADPNQWAVYGRDYANTRFSPLNQINTQNVSQLKLAWAFSLGSLRSNEATPLVIGDTLYVSSSWGPKYVYALDARTGVQKWNYQPDMPDDVLQYACCDVDSRGIAYADGKLFVGLLNGKLAAVDANTGKELWVADVVDYAQGAIITSPPLVVKNLVLIGFGGGEYGARGSLQAYDINTGKQVWKVWTVPGPGEPGNDTWKGDSWKHGGAVLWGMASYDPQTDTILWGTSNPSPWASAVRSTGNSDYGKLTNLYSSSTLAFDPATGKIKWYLQHTPADAWDYDGINEPVLADLPIGGTNTPVAMVADRNGFFYVMNRDTGKLISAQPFVYENWAKGIDIATTRPIENPDKRPGPNHPAKDICPNLLGGKNWQPMSYDPQSHLVYIPANNICNDMTELKEVTYRKGVFYLGKEFSALPGPGGFLGDTVAWDPVQQKKVWDIKEALPFNGGMMTTGGDLVFYGNIAGLFRAVDAKSGKVLWQMQLGSGISAGPITYSVDGKQYVAVVSGRTAAIPAFLGKLGDKLTEATPEGGTLFVFSE